MFERQRMIKLRVIALLSVLIITCTASVSITETFPNTTRKDIAVTGAVTGVAWSHDGSRIAVTSGNGHYVTVLDSNGTIVSQFNHQFNGPNEDDSVGVAKDYVVLPPEMPPPYTEDVPMHDKVFSLWNTETGQFIENVEGPPTDSLKHANWMALVAISPDGSTIAMGTLSPFSPAYIFSANPWKLDREIGFKRPDGYLEGMRRMEFSVDDKTLVAAVGIGKIQVIDWRAGTLTRQIEAFPDAKAPSSIYSMALSPDGRYAVVGSFGGMVYKDTGKSLAERVRVFDLQTGEKVAGYTQAIPAVRKLGWSAATATIAIASNNNTVHLWRWRQHGQADILQLDDPVMSLAYSPDGGKLAVGNGDHITLFTFETF